MNTVNADVSRVVEQEKTEYFLTIESSPIWLSESYYHAAKLTYDGENYQDERNKILYGAYFFLANSRVEY